MLDLILWEFKTPKKMEKNWKCRKMESKWKVNSRGLLDTALMESNFDELDYNNSNDIANNSKGILVLFLPMRVMYWLYGKKNSIKTIKYLPMREFFGLMVRRNTSVLWICLPSESLR